MDSDLSYLLPASLQARLSMIIQTVPLFWNENKHYNHFTNHGPEHSARVYRQKLAQLIQELPNDHALTSDELFVVSAAAWLYETGMQSPNLRPALDLEYRPGDSLSSLQLQRIREKKHLLGKHLIIDSVRTDYHGPPLRLGLISPADDYTWLVAEVCRWCSDEPLENVPCTMPVRGLDVRIRLLVALLRLADQLYIDRSRVSLDLLQRTDMPTRQLARWWAFHYAQTLPIRSGKIRFHYSLPAEQKEYLGHIRSLIESDFTYDNNSAIQYLWNEHCVRLMPDRAPGVSAELAGFRLQRMRPNLLEFLQQEVTPFGSLPDSYDHGYSARGEMIKILLLAANPADTTKLRLDAETRAIDESLQKSEFGSEFDVKPHFAVRVSDLQSLLLRHKPDIVHFSGHGSPSSQIILEDDSGNSQPVPARALGALFSVLKGNIRCVVLNNCYSELQARAIAEHIDCVVGMSRAIGDEAAISFAKAFYQALGFGRDVRTAFDLGCVEIDLKGLDEQDTPRLLCNRRRPENVVFVRGA